MPYMTLDALKTRSSFDPADWNEFFARPGRSGTFAAWEHAIRSRDIDDKLRARYATPFDEGSVPETILDWMTVLFDDRLLRARRYPGTESPDDTDVSGEAKRVRLEIADAADRDKTAHHELPLKASDPTASGVSRGGPIAIGYNSVYGWNDAKAQQRDEGGW